VWGEVIPPIGSERRDANSGAGFYTASFVTRCRHPFTSGRLLYTRSACSVVPFTREYRVYVKQIDGIQHYIHKWCIATRKVNVAGARFNAGSPESWCINYSVT
jgi:hypothetical protein